MYNIVIKILQAIRKSKKRKIDLIYTLQQILHDTFSW